MRDTDQAHVPGRGQTRGPTTVYFGTCSLSRYTTLPPRPKASPPKPSQKPASCAIRCPSLLKSTPFGRVPHFSTRSAPPCRHVVPHRQPIGHPAVLMLQESQGCTSPFSICPRSIAVTPHRRTPVLWGQPGMSLPKPRPKAALNPTAAWETPGPALLRLERGAQEWFGALSFPLHLSLFNSKYEG